jgi:diacylglycerol kinase (ATP)
MDTLRAARPIPRPARAGKKPPIEIVVTPGSGTGRAMRTALALREALQGRRWPSTLQVFPDLDRLHRWAQTTGEPFSMLICVGGDATQSATARAALRRGIPFFAVSSGFGNLFAQAFDHPHGVPGALDLLARGVVVHADVGALNGGAPPGELFLCERSYGLIAEVQEAVEAAARAPRARWQRALAYYRAALGRLRDPRTPRFRVVVDDRVVATDATLVTVANVRTYGAWLPVLPDASPIDGLLDVCVLRRTSQWAVFRTLVRCHLRLPGARASMIRCRGQRVSVAAAAATDDAAPPERLEVLPGRLPLLVTPETLTALERGAPGRVLAEGSRAPLVA